MTQSLEVWGDPIAHSKSPAMHRAAYDALGWDWRYDRRRVDESAFADELSAATGRVRGLSLTMPLKRVAFEAASRRDAHAELTGAVNTLVPGSEGLRGWNTDVGGIVDALVEAGLGDITTARIIGAGATATSALIALGALGAERVEVVARRPETAAALAAVAERSGIRLQAAPFDRPGTPVDLTIATLPGGAALPADVTAALAESGGTLFDVVYGHWPTDLARAWQAHGARAVSGEGMLLHQAVRQIRAFSTGDVDEPLPEEPAVVAVMRRALMGG